MCLLERYFWVYFKQQVTLKKPLDESKTFLKWYINNVFVLMFGIIKDQVTLNELSVNVTGRTFVQNINVYSTL